MTSMYDMSVPVFIRALENLKHVLEFGEKWANENNVELSQLVNARLAPDMNPLTFQVQTASNASKSILSRIADQENPNMEDNEKSFPEFYERIQKTIDVLKTAKRENFEGKEHKEVSLFDGKLKYDSALEYLQFFGLPNFFFHVTTAYAILRKEGVPIGKRNFLGV